MSDKPTIDITLDGAPRTIEAGTTGTLLLQDAIKSDGVIAMRVNGEPWDLDRRLPAGAVVEPIALSSEDGLNILRHSATHVMAQAVQEMFPQVNLGIGPFITDGFYYDFGAIDAVTPEMLREIEKRMKRIVKEGQRFVRRDITEAEGREELADQPYKLELITTKGAGAEGASVEVGAGGLTMYDNVRRDGSVAWTDLCRGPHLPSTRLIGQGFALTKSSSAYWKGDQSGDSLQRIYGTAWASKDDLKAYQTRLAEAARRDHRRIGREMELFMTSDAGPGFPFWLPNGMRVKNALMRYWQKMQDDYGYEQVQTPVILSRSLWETSGHWDHYKDNMYTTQIDDEDFAVKPMNCPGACLIYKSRPRSYRDLPLKLAEAGLDHRHELKGTLHGLFRVRAFTQDDAHLFITPEQICEQVIDTARLITTYYEQFGFPYRVELSTRPEDSMGSSEDWSLAEAGLKEALETMGTDYTLNPGDGAFYGPKIDFHLKDCLGRTWQCGTIQLDFQLPERFELEYTAADGSKRRPILIHRAGFGSFERFIGMLIEQYAGKFPTWLSPCQVKVLPVSEKSRDYAREVGERLREAGLRVKVDERDEKIGYKIREARSIDRVPYMLILGEREVEAGNVSVRDRSGETTQHELDEFIASIKDEIAERRG